MRQGEGRLQLSLSKTKMMGGTGMNIDTLGKCLLISASFIGFIVMICLVAEFITWKAMRDYEAEKRREVVRHIDRRL